jgi:hypothetical protein
MASQPYPVSGSILIEIDQLESQIDDILALSYSGGFYFEAILPVSGVSDINIIDELRRRYQEEKESTTRWKFVSIYPIDEGLKLIFNTDKKYIDKVEKADRSIKKEVN